MSQLHTSSSQTTMLAPPMSINGTQTKPVPAIYCQQVKYSTMKQYIRAYELLYKYAIINDVHWDYPRTNIDQMLAQYFEHLYEQYDKKNQSGRALANHTVNAFLFFNPDIKNTFGPDRLTRTYGYLNGWGVVKPTVSTPALPYNVLVALAIKMLAKRNIDAGVALLLQFDCYLRVSELCSLRLQDIILPDSKKLYQPATAQHGYGFRSGASVIITIPDSKTGKYQSVALASKEIEDILIAYIQYRQSKISTTVPLFGITTKQYSDTLQLYCDKLQLSQHNYSSHSLRHGGAAYHYIQWGASQLQNIMFRGRWKSENSIQVYLQSIGKTAHQPDVPAKVIQIFNERKTDYHEYFINEIKSLSQ